MCNGRGKCMEPTGGNSSVENLWVGIKVQISNLNVTGEIYYRPPGQDNSTDKLFYEEIRDASMLKGLIPLDQFGGIQLARNQLGVLHSWYNLSQKVKKKPG